MSGQIYNRSFYIHNSQEVRCKCTPKEILYEPQEVYLRIYDIVKRENVDIPISNILSIIKQPQIANSTELTTTVVYKLKTDLLKHTKLKKMNTQTDMIKTAI